MSWKYSEVRSSRQQRTAAQTVWQTLPMLQVLLSMTSWYEVEHAVDMSSLSARAVSLQGFNQNEIGKDSKAAGRLAGMTHHRLVGECVVN